MILAILLAVQATVPPPAPQSDIVVIGRRAERALAECLARHCPPAEEVEASLQASVEQFADGRYVAARRTLQAAIRRNKDYAAQAPGLVSSLYATLATVAEHNGDTGIWRTSARENVLVLRRHLGEGNIGTLREELAFADTMAVRGRIDPADTAYLMTQRRAAAAGHAGIAAGAAFRRAWLALMRKRFDAAERFADEAVTLAGNDKQAMVDLRDIVRARIALLKGDDGAIDALTARLRQDVTLAPQIIVSPPMEDINPGSNDLGVALSTTGDIGFGDVGYWIRPSGETANVEILRNKGLGPWAPGIVRQVSRRRYVALAVAPEHPGMYRIDRFTVRSAYDVTTGSRIPLRTGRQTVHVIDLTETDAIAQAHGQRIRDAAAAGGS